MRARTRWTLPMPGNPIVTAGGPPSIISFNPHKARTRRNANDFASRRRRRRAYIFSVIADARCAPTRRKRQSQNRSGQYCLVHY
jgi:hypothetical protein